MLIRGLGRSLFFRIGAYAVFVLGFWLLFQAFDRPSPGLGVLGGIFVLVAMYMMVGFRRYGFGAPSQDAPADETPAKPLGKDGNSGR